MKQKVQQKKAVQLNKIIKWKKKKNMCLDDNTSIIIKSS